MFLRPFLKVLFFYDKLIFYYLEIVAAGGATYNNHTLFHIQKHLVI